LIKISIDLSPRFSFSLLLLGAGWIPPSTTLCLHDVEFTSFPTDATKRTEGQKHWFQLYNQKVAIEKSMTAEEFFVANPTAIEHIQTVKQDAFVQASETSGDMSLNEFLILVERGERKITDINMTSYSGMVISS
jgi:hypothetical protein